MPRGRHRAQGTASCSPPEKQSPRRRAQSRKSMSCRAEKTEERGGTPSMKPVRKPAGHPGATKPSTRAKVRRPGHPPSPGLPARPWGEAWMPQASQTTEENVKSENEADEKNLLTRVHGKCRKWCSAFPDARRESHQPWQMWETGVESIHHWREHQPMLSRERTPAWVCVRCLPSFFSLISFLLLLRGETGTGRGRTVRGEKWRKVSRNARGE